MKDVFLYLMIYAGSVLMAYNIYRYICFSRDVRKRGNWDREQRLFNLPIMLLVMFFIGYLVVGIFGKPDLVMAGILFGGSIFVFVMLLLIRRAVKLFFSAAPVMIKVLVLPISGILFYGLFETILFTDSADQRALTDFRELFFFLLAGIVLACSYEYSPDKSRQTMGA